MNGVNGTEVYHSRPSFPLPNQREDWSLYLALTCYCQPKVAALGGDIGTRNWGQSINRRLGKPAITYHIGDSVSTHSI